MSVQIGMTSMDEYATPSFSNSSGSLSQQAPSAASSAANLQGGSMRDFYIGMFVVFGLLFLVFGLLKASGDLAVDVKASA
jgi:hypothetical protein